MKSLSYYEFICTNNPIKSFKLGIEEFDETFNDLKWLLELAEATANSKKVKFKFKGTLYIDNEVLSTKMDQPISYFADLIPFYYMDLLYKIPDMPPINLIIKSLSGG